MTRKKRSDSIEAAVQSAQAEKVVPPSGIDLDTDEMAVWDQMVTVRTEWVEFDLILLAKIVKLEVKLRSWWKLLESSGPMIRNKRETLIENPILRSINTLQHQQLSIIAKMHIMSRGDPRSLNKPKEGEIPVFDDRNVYNLLAKP